MRAQLSRLAQERKRLFLKLEEDALARRRAEHEREEVLAHLYQSNHRQRLRLARDLHDHAGQHTTSLRLGLTRLRQHIRSQVGLAALTKLMVQLDALGTDLHRVATELRPTALQDCGLIVSLEAMIVDWQATNKPQVALEIRGSEEDLSEEAGITLFRFVQEALTNVSKHAAGASSVRVVLAFDDGSVALTVEDDGIGFRPGPNLVRDLIGAHRFGIIGMKERVALVGGDFTLASAPGSGTRLHIRVPRQRSVR